MIKLFKQYEYVVSAGSLYGIILT